MNMEMSDNKSLITYESKDGKISFDVPLDQETVWLTQDKMSKLFERTIPTINEHIKNIFKENELEENSVIRKFRITASDGKTYNTNQYNLDVIISVGYRVKSKRGTQFRIWATQVLKDHLLNGYSLNSRKVLELEKRISAIESHIQKRTPIDKEVVLALKYLMDKVDPDTSLFGKS